MPTQSQLIKIFPKLIIFTNFLGSFLLFLVQPLIGKFLLPYFGGSSIVWIISVSFFTGMLFFGYLYVFFLTKLKLKGQLFFHLFFLLALVGFHTFNFLNQDWFTFILPNNLTVDSTSVGFVLQTLFLSVGLLFLILATTDTLLQSWYSQVTKDPSPYFLYIVSNIASILGLFAYPFFLEIFFGNLTQSVIWSVLFLIYIVCFLVIIFLSYFLTKNQEVKIDHIAEKNVDKEAKVKPVLVLAWFFYSSLPVMTFLVITENLSRGIASFPLVWILPLFFYLISFVIAFKVSLKPLQNFLVFLCLVLIVSVLTEVFKNSYFLQLFFNNLLVFVVGLLCHGYLYDTRPRNLKWLSTFYLLISFGGAMAGVFISLLVPLVFDNYYEFPLVLFLTLYVCLRIVFNRQQKLNTESSVDKKQKANKISGKAILSDKLLKQISTVLIGASLVLLGTNTSNLLQETSHRSYFGALKLSPAFWSSPEEDSYYRNLALVHGRIFHGQQIFGYENSGKTTYYSEISGFGLAFNYFQAEKESVDSAIIGLGVGMASSYNRENDKMVYYEIDPLIKDIATENFTYLDDVKGELDVRIGDARLVLQSELDNQAVTGYDILGVDAFSDNAIPVHLLTKEAFEIYRQSINPGGAIVYHISNTHLDLIRVLTPLCEEFKVHCISTDNIGSLEGDVYNAQYLIMTENDDFLNYLNNFEDSRVEILTGDGISKSNLNYWTDDRNNILPLIKFF